MRFAKPLKFTLANTPAWLLAQWPCWPPCRSTA